MTSPTISVITPAFNVAAFVGPCIDSVLQQSFGDFEHLIVDDGSTDATPQALAAYASLDDRVRVIRSPNRGVSHARNLAMAEARGAFFAFLDADDEWDPGFLAAQMAVLARRPDADIVTGNAINAGSTLDGTPVRSWPADERELTLVDLIQHEDAVFIMSVLRRRVYDTVGGFDERLHHSEDWEFWLRAALAGFRFVANPAPLGCYRRRDDSASANEAAMLAGVIEVLGRTAARCGRERPAARAAIEAQLRRFSRRHLFCRGKAALLEGRFSQSARWFGDLRRLQPTLPVALLAVAARVAPRAILYAYRLKRAWHAAPGLQPLRARGLGRGERRERVSTNG